MKKKFIEHYFNDCLTQEDFDYLRSLPREEALELYQEIQRMEILLYLRG